MAPQRRVQAAVMFVLMTVLAGAAATRLEAHDVPNDVLIQAFLKPEGSRLRMLIRVPLIALRDMTWPFRARDVLDTTRADTELRNAAMLWLGDESTIYEENRRLGSPSIAAIRATLPTDRSFESFDRALALVTTPRPGDTDDITVKEGFLDVLFEYPIASASSHFSLEPRWGRLGVHALTRLRVFTGDGGVRTFELQGDPGLVDLDPTRFQSVARFADAGVRHVMDGVDYLLLTVCLVLPFRRVREAAPVVGAFAAAHVVTLLASAAGMAPEMLWFPPFVNMLIAACVVAVSVENLAGISSQWKRVSAALAGLTCGFSFAFALRPALQFAGRHMAVSTLSFLLGIDIALLIVLTVTLSLLALLFRYTVAERMGIILISAMTAHTGWHSMTTRGTLLAQYQITTPELTPLFFVGVIRWAMIAVVVAGVSWLIGVVRKSARARLPKSHA